MGDSAQSFISSPSGALSGVLHVPGDKSISHRALLLGAIAEGETRIQHLLMGEDNLATLGALRALGVTIHVDEQVVVQGVGLHGFTAPDHPLDLGNSGTGMRLMAGLLAAQRFSTQLVGDASLTRRPMRRIADPLKQMGAQVTLSAQGTPPIHIEGGHALQPITFTLPVASAQVKSCLLLAGLYASGTTRLTEPAVSRDHTERLLKQFGCPITQNGLTVSLTGPARLFASEVIVPGDISSAAFFMVAAAMTPGSDILLSRVGINPTRTGVIDILRRMGADIRFENERLLGQEPVADIRVRYAPLKGIDIPVACVPLAIDEFPILFIAAACASGQTVLRGAEELRVKESDRLDAMARGLTALGISVDVLPDGLIIEGGTLQGGMVDSAGDHRIAMAFSIAGNVAEAPVTILDTENVATSFPTFLSDANAIGLSVREGVSNG